MTVIIILLLYLHEKGPTTEYRWVVGVKVQVPVCVCLFSEDSYVKSPVLPSC